MLYSYNSTDSFSQDLLLRNFKFDYENSLSIKKVICIPNSFYFYRFS